MPIQRRIGHRKNRLIAAVGLVAVLAACGAPTANQPAAESTGDVPDKPSKAVTLNILDVAGNLQLTQPMIDEVALRFVNPTQLVARVKEEPSE